MIVKAVRPLTLFPDEVSSVLAGRQTLLRRYAPTTTQQCPFGEPGDQFWLRERLVLLKGWVYDVDFTPCLCPPCSDDQEYLPAELMPRICSRGSVVLKECHIEPISYSTEDDWLDEDCPTRLSFSKSWTTHYPDVHLKDDPHTWVLYIKRVR